MNRILDIDLSGLSARVEAGVVNGVLNQPLARFGICFSHDPVSNAIATIGGNIIENAGGPHALKYGVTYHHILAVDAVLADGTITTFVMRTPTGPISSD
jgi:glycolate oxidase